MGLGGGTSGVLNTGNLDFALDYIQDQAYSIRIDDIFMKCAILGRAIIQGHPFMDGNKRTGFEVIDLFLNKNGFRLLTEVEEGVAFTIDVATGSLSVEDIREWIQSHSEKYINRDLMVKEQRVTYMKDQSSGKPVKKRENPYNISEESIALIDASIKRNRKLLEELAKH